MSAFDMQALAPGQRELLTQSRRVSMGNGDRKAPVLRPGALDAMQLPSRMGSRLVHRDGRVEMLEAQGPAGRP